MKTDGDEGVFELHVSRKLRARLKEIDPAANWFLQRTLLGFCFQLLPAMERLNTVTWVIFFFSFLLNTFV